MRRNGRNTDTLTEVVKGAIAGAVGVWAMDQVGWYMYNREAPEVLQQEQEARVEGMDRRTWQQTESRTRSKLPAYAPAATPGWNRRPLRAGGYAGDALRPPAAPRRGAGCGPRSALRVGVIPGNGRDSGPRARSRGRPHGVPMAGACSGSGWAPGPRSSHGRSARRARSGRLSGRLLLRGAGAVGRLVAMDYVLRFLYNHEGARCAGRRTSWLAVGIPALEVMAEEPGWPGARSLGEERQRAGTALQWVMGIGAGMLYTALGTASLQCA